MTVLSEALYLFVKGDKHWLTLSNQASVLSLEGQIPNGVEHDFELITGAHFHEVETD